MVFQPGAVRRRCSACESESSYSLSYASYVGGPGSGATCSGSSVSSTSRRRRPEDADEAEIRMDSATTICTVPRLSPSITVLQTPVFTWLQGSVTRSSMSNTHVLGRSLPCR